MMDERRRADRLRTNINLRWETLRTQGRGTISDVSVSGCFVLSGGEVSPGELMKMDVVLQDHIGTLWGYIVYFVPDMGFAVRFADSDGQVLLNSIPR